MPDPIDFNPQRLGGSYLEPDFVMNTANDGRFLRPNLHNARFRLRLLDPRGRMVDVAGDGAAPFAGGRRGDSPNPRDHTVHSMERVHPIGPGDEPSSWRACENPSPEQMQQIRTQRRLNVVATPGQRNSGGEDVPNEDPNWRSRRR